MAERIDSKVADPITILACRIMDKLARLEVLYNDQYALVHAEPMCMRQLYRAMNRFRYGELWPRAMALYLAKKAVKITTVKHGKCGAGQSSWSVWPKFQLRSWLIAGPK